MVSSAIWLATCTIIVHCNTCTKRTSCYTLMPCSVTATVTSLELCYNDNNSNIANNPHFIVHAEMCCEFFLVVNISHLSNCFYTRAATCNTVWGLLKESDKLYSLFSGLSPFTEYHNATSSIQHWSCTECNSCHFSNPSWQVCCMLLLTCIT